ncbi:MAG: hypothetical protein J7M25_06825 [Deltaproteobacteria bacterium]|nr:hypothetical protein [Deltaproteobacteria bacterium]
MTMPEAQQAIEAMTAVGFTKNEARVYVALLGKQPATGYELASEAKVPRSAIYGVLRRLQASGLVNLVSDKPARYVPRPPSDVATVLSDRFSRDVDRLKTVLESISDQDRGMVTWTVHGYDAALAEARRLIESGKHRVHASLWAREATALQSELLAASARGVDLVFFSFTVLPFEARLWSNDGATLPTSPESSASAGSGDRSSDAGPSKSKTKPKPKAKTRSMSASKLNSQSKFKAASHHEGSIEILSYNIPEDVLSSYWQHQIILVVDQRWALVGAAEPGQQNRAVVTEEPALVEMATANIVLDVTLWGGKMGRDTSHAVVGLTDRLAPIDDLVSRYGMLEVNRREK